ncbi:outer membrane protein assembly factor BamA [Bacteriovorax stolpii]|uniref:Outer membrane protein assembly factor BamA n=1 Tax=Bacteriovorax stolpii TaxID=960 RepID=A0A2K9NV98_BACTC|nr:outer membrane protein assembly factor BamA [Bacteriovorax stolpii]AUN99420.1 outer membrane protein assembly factor BamA [Bacteriovorax stolpii]QDK40601.1 outer membrane protein assembly factor BamA [Bacteriovorax stolpii]TDP55037.1 Beta-barrel assembly machine subunit BamA [Bacteriovorax stolpii]BDT29591.1 outer membrane protein assembly factor BamA [Bacteriovorax sp. HI3]
MSLRFISLFFFLTLSLIGHSYAAEDLGARVDLFKIDRIDVQGIKKVEKEAVLEKIGSRPGMTLDNYLLKKDLEKIYSMKYFESVEAHQDTDNGQNVLRFVLKEKPIITKITFEGNDGLSDDDLKGQVKSKVFSILDTTTIKSDVQGLLKFYEEKGYFLASVDFQEKKINDENTELIFNIKEYDKVKVKKINFLGNVAFKDEELKSILQTQEDSLFSFMSGTGNFKEINFQNDIERLKYFYRMKGYLQINIGTPEITVSEDKKWVFITMKMTEGPQFTVNKITFQGEVLFPENELHEKMVLKEQETYSEESLRKDIQMLTEMYQDEGYAFANVIRNLNVVPGENKVDVEFSFEKGKIAYFGRVKIKGNPKSRDKVIRREITIKEGQKFNGTALRQSRENVQRLGFYEPDSIVFNTVSPKDKEDVLDVEVSVKEKNTGQISLGAGYSTATGGFFQASVTQSNFRGMGQNLSFSLNLAKSSNTFSVDFTEPYFLDTKWLLGGGVFVSNNDTSSSYSERRKGLNVRVGYPIMTFTNLYVTYKLEDTTIKSVDDPTIDKALENGLASSIQTSIVHDKRDDRSDPRKGYYLSYSTEYTGVGGDKKWLKNEAEGRGYYPVIGDLIFRTRFYAGKIDQVDSRKIPRTEKFTLGGSRNLRGYSYEDIGPTTRMKGTDGVVQDFNLGGQFMSFTNFELQHPLSREAGLKWVLFFDAGHAGDLKNVKVYTDYGFGFRWFSPIGVLRFEFGYPLTGKFKEQGSQFHFDIGQLF